MRIELFTELFEEVKGRPMVWFMNKAVLSCLWCIQVQAQVLQLTISCTGEPVSIGNEV